MIDFSNPWLIASITIAGSILAGYLVRAILVKRLRNFLKWTATDVDDLVLEALNRYLPLWFLLGGVLLATRIAPFSISIVEMADRVCAGVFVLSLALSMGRLASDLLREWTIGSGANVATTSIIQNVTRIAIVTIGGLLFLSNMGLSVTPLLTAMGIGSLAVALALQSTLSNLFAGVHLAISRPIRVGDYVELETGKKGFITWIGWRATRLRELSDNIIIVPNSRLADMLLTNYSLPDTEQAALVQMGVSYDSDLEQVERVTVEVAREVLGTVQGSVALFDPFIRFHTLNQSSIDFTVILRVRTYTDRYLVIHEFIKRIKTRFVSEGIDIPFPQFVVHGNWPTPPDKK
jgi:small-conductance mechanosensitive channel